MTAMFQKNGGILVSMVNGDPNTWAKFFKGGAMVFWQVSLAVLLFIPMVLGYYKFFNLIRYWRGDLIWAFLNTQSYILYTVMIACSFCFCYVAVDPLHSRGIYNNLADTVLTTLAIPPTLTGTFIITMIWVVGFNNTSLFSRKEVVSRISKVFVVIMLLFFLVDLTSSFIKGVYINTSNTQYIIGIYYIVAAFAIVMFYIIVSIKIRNKINVIQEEANTSSKSLNVLRQLVSRNMWLFALFYGLWIITAAAAITTLNYQPTGRLTLFWFVYALIAFINMCHVGTVNTSGTKSGTSGSDAATASADFRSKTDATSMQSGVEMKDDDA